MLFVGPAESSSPSDAKGLIPLLSKHYKAKPSIYHLNEMPYEHIAPGIQRKFIMGSNSMIVEWKLKKGFRLPLHYHQHEQINYLKSGKIKIYSQGNKYLLQPGDVIVFPSYVPHEFIALEDSVIIGQVTPVREDFLAQLSGVPTSKNNKILEARN